MTESTDGTEYLFVTEYFHPEPASTGQLLTDLAVGLHERGLDVSVYTGQPNYHSGSREKQPSHSVHEGVPIHRISAPQFSQTSALRRGFNWLVFTVWMFFRLLVSRPQKKRELVVVSNPPMLPLAMWLVCRLRGWEFTYIVNDVYPDAAIEAGYFSPDGITARFWRWLHRHVFGDAKHVVALGPAMRDRIIECGGDPASVVVIPYWADETFVEPRAKTENWFAEEHDTVDTFTLLYSGNIGINHDLETVIRAAARFDADELRLLIIGEGDRKDTIQALAERLGVAGEQVRFLPYQPREDLPYSLTAGDVSVVSVSKGMKGICVSSKLYTSMAAGMPVLVIAEDGDDEARLIEAHNAGVHVTQGDINRLTTTIREWMDDPSRRQHQGANARSALVAQYTDEQSIDRYYELLTDGSLAETVPEPMQR